MSVLTRTVLSVLLLGSLLTVAQLTVMALPLSIKKTGRSAASLAVWWAEVWAPSKVVHGRPEAHSSESWPVA
jgi:hypothetical protein